MNDKGRYRSHPILRCDAVLSLSPALGIWASGVSRATRTKLVPNVASGLLNGPAKGGRVSLGEEVRNGTADGVVAACDCRQRHRVGERRRRSVANETAARGGRRIPRRMKPAKKTKGETP
jgi:hypothetical protein